MATAAQRPPLAPDATSLADAGGAAAAVASSRPPAAPSSSSPDSPERQKTLRELGGPQGDLPEDYGITQHAARGRRCVRLDGGPAILRWVLGKKGWEIWENPDADAEVELDEYGNPIHHSGPGPGGTAVAGSGSASGSSAAADAGAGSGPLSSTATSAASPSGSGGGSSGSSDDTEWHLYWRSGRFKPSDYHRCSPYQRVNHLPKSSAITKKDSLVRNLRKFRGIHGSIFNFAPDSFLLPTEYTKFVKEYTKQEDKGIWICKPSDLSRGRKIFLIRDLSELIYDQPYVIQRYIGDPLTVGGYKLDLRIYVLVTSCHPLRAYLFKEGMVRFGTEKYDGSEGTDLSNLYSHLTNSSINKYSGSYTQSKDVIGAGCKWTLTQLFDRLRKEGHDVDRMWARVKALLICTTMILPGVVPNNPSCFEVLGFDVMLDRNLKPWLIEVNCSPALGQDGQVDSEIKLPLVNDTIDVLMYEAAEERREESAVARQREESAKAARDTRERLRVASAKKAAAAAAAEKDGKRRGGSARRGRGGSSGSGGGGGGGSAGGGARAGRAAGRGRAGDSGRARSRSSSPGPGSGRLGSTGRMGRAGGASSRDRSSSRERSTGERSTGGEGGGLGSSRGRSGGRGGVGSGGVASRGGRGDGRGGVGRGDSMRRPPKAPVGGDGRRDADAVDDNEYVASAASASATDDKADEGTAASDAAAELAAVEAAAVAGEEARAETAALATATAEAEAKTKAAADAKAEANAALDEAAQKAAASGPWLGAFGGQIQGCGLGNYELLFPFNDATKRLAHDMSSSSMRGSTSDPIVAMDALKGIMSEVRDLMRATTGKKKGGATKAESKADDDAGGGGSGAAARHK